MKYWCRMADDKPEDAIGIEAVDSEQAAQEFAKQQDNNCAGELFEGNDDGIIVYVTESLEDQQQPDRIEAYTVTMEYSPHYYAEPCEVVA